MKYFDPSILHINRLQENIKLNTEIELGILNHTGKCITRKLTNEEMIKYFGVCGVI